MKFTDLRTYQIHIQGQLEVEDISPFSHMGLVIEHVEGPNTSITLRTDQSGMIGLIRHLHGLGLVLISMSAGLGNLLENGSIPLEDKQE
jgi:hypothetical protein